MKPFFIAVWSGVAHQAHSLVLPYSSEFFQSPRLQHAIAEPQGQDAAFDVAKLRREQNESLCDARTRHYTGQVPLDHGKEIFYWFFESANNPKDDPIVIWLSGGPGGASTFAALTEVSPCWINTTDGTTYHNPYHWAQNTNLLIVDQPAGVGFSRASEDAAFHVGTLEDAAHDFNSFLYNFFTSAFPEISSNPLHVATESYGGRWGPVFVHHIIDLQTVRAEKAIKNPIQSLILINAVIGGLGGQLSSANYEFGCLEQGKAVKLGVGFNSTSCDKIRELGPKCEKYAALCEREDDLQVCKDASSFCAGSIGPWVDLHGRSPYNIQVPCHDDESGLCIDTIQPVTSFLDSDKVKKQLGFENFNYSVIGMDVLQDFSESGALTQSVVREFTSILETTPVRVLFMNGDADALVITPGQMRIVDELRWIGQLDYRAQKWGEWYYENNNGLQVRGGLTKSFDKLSFVSFESAGHMVPQDDPQGALHILTEWLKETV